jgi:hypothetical protein
VKSRQCSAERSRLGLVLAFDDQSICYVVLVDVTNIAFAAAVFVGLQQGIGAVEDQAIDPDFAPPQEGAVLGSEEFCAGEETLRCIVTAALLAGHSTDP